jgi:hypothetical protein
VKPGKRGRKRRTRERLRREWGESRRNANKARREWSLDKGERER